VDQEWSAISRPRLRLESPEAHPLVGRRRASGIGRSATRSAAEQIAFRGDVIALERREHARLGFVQGYPRREAMIPSSNDGGLLVPGTSSGSPLALILGSRPRPIALSTAILPGRDDARDDYLRPVSVLMDVNSSRPRLL
jgi:hypothetical protein